MKKIVLNDPSNPVNVEIRIPALHACYPYTHDELSEINTPLELVKAVVPDLVNNAKTVVTAYNKKPNVFVVRYANGLPAFTVFVKVYDAVTSQVIV
jgi:hypothetical protein